jgi:hypothetical protein
MNETFVNKSDVIQMLFCWYCWPSLFKLSFPDSAGMLWRLILYFVNIGILIYLTIDLFFQFFIWSQEISIFHILCFVCAVKHNFKRRTRVKIHETENADSFEAHSLPNGFSFVAFFEFIFLWGYPLLHHVHGIYIYIN